jgi:ADP-ribose pyrophosphatase YjhB (NUDIX family)
MPAYHPQPNDNGKAVPLEHPTMPTSLASWDDPHAVATVIPGGIMPHSLNGIVFLDWDDVPTNERDWARVGGQSSIGEPEFLSVLGKVEAAGAVVLESDGRVWVVSPSNCHAGYTNTFPKGRAEGEPGRQATAIREVYEESGLKIQITGFLADATRSMTRTRYYLAKRTGGNPASMGWESQAVHLVPIKQLASFLTHSNDAPLLEKLLASHALRFEA